MFQGQHGRQNASGERRRQAPRNHAHDDDTGAVLEHMAGMSQYGADGSAAAGTKRRRGAQHRQDAPQPPVSRDRKRARIDVAPGVTSSSSARAADGEQWILFLKKPGDLMFAELEVSARTRISRLLPTVAALLHISGSPTSLLLRHVVDVTTEATRTLTDSAITIEEAGLSNMSRIIVDKQSASSASSPSDTSRSTTTPAQLTELPASDEISRVVGAIRAGRVQVVDDDGNDSLVGHLVLPPDLTWPCATNHKLFVRDCYAPLYEGVLQQCKRKAGSSVQAQHRVIVTGQPGIGKSVFGWYIIYRVLTEQPGRTVIYASFSSEQIVVIPPSGALFEAALQTTSIRSLSHLSGDPVLITDSFVPPVMSMHTVVVSSPDRLAQRGLRDKMNSFLQPLLYLPIPTESEIRRLANFAFSDVLEAHKDMNSRLQLWGPIPRCVLVHVSPAAQRSALKDALAVPMDTLTKLGVQASAYQHDIDATDAARQIVHIRSRGQDAPAGSSESVMTTLEYYERGHTVLASPPFLRYLVERMLKECA